MRRRFIHSGQGVVEVVNQGRGRNPGPFISGDYKPYDCPITGKTVDGKREHRENLARHGCRILEKGEVEWHRKTADEYRTREIERFVDRAISETAKEMT